MRQILLRLLTFTAVCTWVFVSPTASQTIEDYDATVQRKILENMAITVPNFEASTLQQRQRLASAIGAEPELFEPKIVNGAATDDAPGVVAILIKRNGTFGVHCSGSLIGSMHVLTAAHCIEKDKTRSKYRVFAQGSGLYEVASLIPNPDYSFPNADLAILKLSSPVVGAQPIAIDDGPRPPNQFAMTIMGYGLTGAKNNDAGIKRDAVANSSNCPDNLFGRTDDLICWTYDPNQFVSVGWSGSTCFADSGGPAVRGIPSNFKLIGVHSGAKFPRNSTRPCSRIKTAFDVHVAYHLPWVRSVVGDDLGKAATEQPVVDERDPDSYFSNDRLLNQVNTVFDWDIELDTPISHARMTLNGRDDGTFNVHMTVEHFSPIGVGRLLCRDKSLSQFKDCQMDNLPKGTLRMTAVRQTGAGMLQATLMRFE